jgi:hypothetical protein
VPEIVMVAPAFPQAQAVALPADSPARLEAMDSNLVSAPQALPAQRDAPRQQALPQPVAEQMYPDARQSAHRESA